MKFKFVNNKKIIAVILSGFIVINMIGCSKTETVVQEDYEQSNQKTTNEEPQINPVEPSFNFSNETKESNIESTEPNIEPVEPNIAPIEPEPEINSNNNEDKIYSNTDEKAIETFNSLEEDIDNILNSESISNAKDKAKGVFVTIVDFLFYDSEINGITFDELTDSGKQKILAIAYRIDTKIENKFPDYKETIAETAKDAFNKASELIKKGANNLKDFSKEKLGEENYNAIVEAKDELVEYSKEAIDIIGDVGSDLLASGKEYIKNWYENFRN